MAITRSSYGWFNILRIDSAFSCYVWLRIFNWKELLVYKPKKCKDCRIEFMPFKFAQPRCFPCAMLFGRRKAEDKAKRDMMRLERDKRKEHKQAKEKIKPLSKWKSEAQAVFNQYIRLRDKDLSCICCNAKGDYKWDAGHYLSRGSHPWLAFNEDNVHKQRARPCNSDKSGNIARYRIKLVRKIGIERVEALENNHDNKHKMTVDDYKRIIAEYRAKIKQLKGDV